MPSSFVLRKPKRGGWFLARNYPHFDYPWPYEKAAAYVADPVAVRRHAFLPFLSFEHKKRRYSTSTGEPVVKTKLRELAMPSHADGYVFAWYAFQLSRWYEEMLRASGLHECVLAYRSGIGNNITFARDAFDDVAARPGCLAIAFDLKNFFPTINHATLKRNWAHVLGTDGLPADHFAVFRAITSYAQVDRDACYKRLGIKPSQPVPRPLCSPARFRAEIKGAKLVVVNREDHGIPQGSQISALLSNIYMLEFDRVLCSVTVRLGGSYRRYSDDLLLIMPSQHSSDDVLRIVKSELAKLGGTTDLNADKTEIARFQLNTNGYLHCDRPLQYLGFTFDGERRIVRSSTLSKYSRRLVYAVRRARKAAKKADTPVFKRDVYRRFTHLGKANFVSRYCRDAGATLGSDAIRRQMRKHMRRVAALFNDPDLV